MDGHVSQAEGRDYTHTPIDMSAAQNLDKRRHHTKQCDQRARLDPSVARMALPLTARSSWFFRLKKRSGRATG
jgi:hypothetical protein